MAKSLYFISFVNSLCCLLLLIYQIPPFLEATDYVSIYRRKQYVIETLKFLTYAIGLLNYITLGCYKSCFECISNNYTMKFSIISMILSFVVTYDGVTREIYHYIAFGVINFFCTVLVYKEIVKEWEEEMRRLEFIDENSGYEKVRGDLIDVQIDKGEIKRREAERIEVL